MRDTRRTRVVLSLLLLTALTLVVLNLRGSGDGLRGGAGGVFGPVENAAGAIVRPVRDFISGLGSLGSKDQQITDLQAQRDQLQQQLNASEYTRARAQQLNDLLRIAALGQYKTVFAQVVGTGPAQSFQSTVTIDAGTLDGLKVDMTVINGQGLVGRIISVSGTSAVVQLLTDATSTVAARIEGTNQGDLLLNGTGSPTALQLALTDPQTPVKVGDRLVKALTPGSPYVAGVPLGTVTAVGGLTNGGFKTADVRPFVDVTSLDVVGVVIAGPRTDPRDAVLPPKPTPAATTPPSGSTLPSGSASGSSTTPPG